MVTWLDRRMNIPCKVFTRIEAAKDEYGNVIYAEVENDTVCFIQPMSQEEIQDGRAELGQYLVHLPSTIVGILDGFSRLEVQGFSYEAVEPPAIYPSLTTSSVHHVEIIVRRGSA
jgi:hypothetical protein